MNLCRFVKYFIGMSLCCAVDITLQLDLATCYDQRLWQGNESNLRATTAAVLRKDKHINSHINKK